MKVVLPEKNSFKKKDIIIYSSIAIVCIISIIIAFYVQFYARTDNRQKKEVTVGIGQKTEEETTILKAEFDQIFTNQVEMLDGQDIHNDKRQETDKPLIYTKTEKKENKQNSYDIEVHIPYININNKTINEYNKEIKDFETKMNHILDTKNKNTIYTVEYVATIQNNILSLMVRSNLKEGSSAQRVIIQTYNYDLKNNKELSLEEVLKIENLNSNDVQQTINTQINEEQKKVEDLKNLGYHIYSRDVSNSRYKIENTKEFYLTNQSLYVLYAYGNESFTSEMDLIIF